MADTTLRPRKISEILDAAFALLRQHYAKYVSIMAIGYLPWLTFTMIMGRAAGVDETGAFGAMEALEFLGMVLWFPIINAAVILAASESYLGREISIGTVLREAFGRFFSILVAVFIRAVASFIGLLLFVIPGIWIYLRFFAVPAAVVVEKRGAFSALGRSGTLTKGHTLRLFGALFLTYFIVMIFMMVAIVAGGLVASPMVASVLSAVITILVWPMVALVETLLYYDLRVRSEGYDLELMAVELGESRQPAY